MTDDPEAAPAAAPEAAPAIVEEVAHEVGAEVSRVEATVAAWVLRHLHDSPLSRATEAWNHVMQVLPHLVQDLKEA